MPKDLIIRSSSTEFLIFERQTHDKGIQVRFEEGDLWLTQKAMSELYDCSTDNISLHLKNIYNDLELDKGSTTEDFSIVQKEGNRKVKRNIPMTMEDWSTRIDKFLLADDRDILKDAGKISHEIACDKALTEFEKYRVKQDKLYKSDFDLLMEETEYKDNNKKD